MLHDGFYLSVYLEVDPLLNIAQRSLRHDHNMALFEKRGQQIRLIHHWELERITGIKHHNVAFFSAEDAFSFIDMLLATYHIKVADLMGIMGTPQLDTIGDFYEIACHSNIAFHSLSHLFSVMLADTETFHSGNIIALAVDGGPDLCLERDSNKRNFFCGAVSIRGELNIFPIQSPGKYWDIIKKRLRLEEGTLMALAYACKAETLECFEELPDYLVSSDMKMVQQGLFRIIERIFCYEKGDCGTLFHQYDDRFTLEENRISMVMKIVQQISSKKINETIHDILQKYGLVPAKTVIAISGGFALNCPTNTEIMNRFGFKGQQIVPCVNDGGLAIGMGLQFFHSHMESFSFTFPGAFLGNKDLSHEEILQKYALFIERVDPGVDWIVDDILNGLVVWFSGRAEIGPRALGHRSILADPLNARSKKLLNEAKLRQWWRPVAPIVLEEEISNWFECAFPSPYMLNNFTVRKDKCEKISSVVHMDGTSRVQTISCLDDPELYEIVNQFYKKTGVPILCNTSLNDRGEPIIDRMEEAINFSLRKRIRVLYANGHRYQLRNHELYDQSGPLERKNGLFIKYASDTKVTTRLNPCGLTDEELYLSRRILGLSLVDIINEKNVNLVKKMVKMTSMPIADDM